MEEDGIKKRSKKGDEDEKNKKVKQGTMKMW